MAHTPICVLILLTGVCGEFGDKEAAPRLLSETIQVDRAEWHKILDKRVSALEKKGTTHSDAIKQRLDSLEAKIERLGALEENPGLTSTQGGLTGRTQSVDTREISTDADSLENVMCRCGGGRCGQRCSYHQKCNGQSYAGAWLVERATMVSGEWKQGRTWNDANFSGVFDAQGKWKENWNLESASWMMLDLGHNFAVLTKEVLDFNVIHLSKGLKHAFGSRSAIRKAMEPVEQGQTEFICPAQQSVVAFVPIALVSEIDAKTGNTRIDETQELTDREVMVKGTVVSLARCFKYVVGLVAGKNETLTLERLSAMKLPLTDTIVVPLQPAEIRGRSFTAFPAKASFYVSSLLEQGRWPDAKFVYFTEDDQLPMMRVGAEELFAVGNKEHPNTNGRPLVFTPHRMQTARHSFLNQGYPESTVGDLRKYSGWCANEATINHVHTNVNHSGRDCDKVLDPLKTSFQENDDFENGKMNTTAFHRIYWLFGFPHYGTFENCGVNFGMPAKVDLVMKTCAQHQPHTAF